MNVYIDANNKVLAVATNVEFPTGVTATGVPVDGVAAALPGLGTRCPQNCTFHTFDPISQIIGHNPPSKPINQLLADAAQEMSTWAAANPSGTASTLAAYMATWASANA
ncbi:MAG TPA: hypothetical protein VIU62_05210 [Chloroflexota bacterium]|jgi:hypothetical protein